jgi:ABC-2 type transport system ATP-binding protein
MKNAISIQNFSKSFGEQKIINDLSFEVKEKDIFAFLGPNGSGKTTTLRCLLQMIPADSGELLIFDKTYDVSLGKDVGYLPEERGLYLNSKVLDLMIYVAELKGMERYRAKTNALQYLDEVGLLTHKDKPVKQLSSGQQQKVQIGITIINDPHLLILDEPTKGLDPLNKDLLLSILLKLNKSGTTIIFSTHQMEEAEKIANNVMIINKGRKVIEGPVKKIKYENSENLYKVYFTQAYIPDGKEPFEIISNSDSNILIRLFKDDEERKALDFLVKRNIKITGFVRQIPSLNDIFIKLIKND